LKGCKGSPNDIIGPRLENRFLIISSNGTGESFGFVNFINKEFKDFLKKHFSGEEDQTFFETKISLISEKSKESSLSEEKSIEEIKKAIRAICLKGWIPSSKMTKEGTKVEYNAINAGGLTLEAELGIAP